MIKKLLAMLVASVLLTGCSVFATGGAEVTGLSLLHDRRTSKALATDEGIELEAAYELNSYDDTRNLCHFNITSYNGIVLVTGEAPNEKLRNKIISIVRVISGVKLIHNKLVVAQPSTYTSRSKDALITTKVKTSLSNNIKNIPGFDATRVKVITEGSVVYLLGLVHKNEGYVATEITRREQGVKKVVQVFEYIE